MDYESDSFSQQLDTLLAQGLDYENIESESIDQPYLPYRSF